MFFRLSGHKPLASLVTNPIVFADGAGKVHMDLELVFDTEDDAKAFLVKNGLPTVVFKR